MTRCTLRFQVQFATCTWPSKHDRITRAVKREHFEVTLPGVSMISNATVCANTVATSSASVIEKNCAMHCKGRCGPFQVFGKFIVLDQLPMIYFGNIVNDRGCLRKPNWHSSKGLQHGGGEAKMPNLHMTSFLLPHLMHIYACTCAIGASRL